MTSLTLTTKWQSSKTTWWRRVSVGNIIVQMLTVFCRVSVMDIFSLLQKKHRIMFIYPSLKDKQLLQNFKNTILTKNVKIVFYPIYLELNVCCCFQLFQFLQFWSSVKVLLWIDWDFIFHINVPDTAHVQIAFTGCSYKS